MNFVSGISLDHEVFESATDCHAFLTATKANGHLYRGESRPYPSTCPGTRRVLEDQTLHFQEKTFWIDLAGHFEDWFCDYTGQMTLDSAQMFLQHYGIPTDLLDFTSDPEIALFFASLSNAEDVGLICCMDVQKSKEAAEIFNLTDFTLAPGLQLQRPKKQKGYAFRHRAGLPSDLKAEEAREGLGLSWYGFRKVQHEQYVERHREILSIDDDKVALYVIAYAADFGLSTWQAADIG